jgi:hypothetical protein
MLANNEIEEQLMPTWLRVTGTTVLFFALFIVGWQAGAHFSILSVANQSSGAPGRNNPATPTPAVAAAAPTALPNESIRIEPTMNALHAYVRSIEGKPMPLYLGTERSNRFIVVQQNELYVCSHATTENPSDADKSICINNVSNRFGELEESDQKAAECLAAIRSIDDNSGMASGFCVARTLYSGKKSFSPEVQHSLMRGFSGYSYSFNAGEVFYTNAFLQTRTSDQAEAADLYVSTLGPSNSLIFTK